VPGAPAPPEEDPLAISPHDRRLRVFVSSTLEELAAERRAVREVIARLRLTPVLFELGARAHAPRDLYRAYLAQSDVFIGVYGERYGWIGPGMTISGLEDEYDLSAALPRLIYVRREAPGREPRLAELIVRMQADGGTSTTPYDSPEHLAELVADDLAVLLTEHFATSAPAPPGLAPGWVPTPEAPMVDRTAELALVTELLGDPAVRLVTVSGPGGMGKTRLALAAAEAQVPSRDGVWWVDLSPVQDAGDVPAALAAAIGVSPEGRRPLLDLLAGRLAGRRALLVLDNAEHVLPAAPVLAELLARCPTTQLLVTSRTLLGLRGEHDVPLGPLPVPDPAERDAAAVEAAAAVELFTARARRADPSFAVTSEGAAALADLVRRLDGLPLALELAAARVRTLPPSVLVHRLDRALDLAGDADAPRRQRTLRDTLAWSHDLLTPAERTLLARLSVCAGGWTLDTAEAIGSLDGDTDGDTDGGIDGGIDVLEALSGLVAASLVTSTPSAGGEPRFRMLGLVRTFAAERLRERGEQEAVAERLARHLAGVAAAAAAGLDGRDRRQWRARLDDEATDLGSALRWAVDTDRADLAIALAAPLARWWWARGELVPMGRLAEATAALPSAGALGARDAGFLLWARGATLVAQGRLEEAQPLFADLVDGARDRDDPWLLGHGLVGLALTRPPEDPELPGLYADGVAALRRTGDSWSIAYALVPSGDVALLAGDVPAAVRAHEEALELARSIDDDHLTATVLDQLALDALLAGDVSGARHRLAASAELHRAVRDQEGLAYCLDGLAAVCLAQGDAPAAGRLAGAAAAARAALGISVWPLLRPLTGRLDELVATALGADEDRRQRAAGAAAGPWTALEQGLAAVGGG
jgi:predicted ATPase